MIFFINILSFVQSMPTPFHLISDLRTCHLCCSAAPSLLHYGPSEWHNFHNLHTHSTALQQRHTVYNYLFRETVRMNSFYKNCRVWSGLIDNNLHMSLSNPEEASVAPLG